MPDSAETSRSASLSGALSETPSSAAAASRTSASGAAGSSDAAPGSAHPADSAVAASSSVALLPESSSSRTFGLTPEAALSAPLFWAVLRRLVRWGFASASTAEPSSLLLPAFSSAALPLRYGSMMSRARAPSSSARLFLRITCARLLPAISSGSARSDTGSTFSGLSYSTDSGSGSGPAKRSPSSMPEDAAAPSAQVPSSPLLFR